MISNDQTDFPGMILDSYKPCPEEATCLEDTRESVAFQR